ncbi:MAG: BREX-1 system adenine-specific DNA-methyltransferase PglX [Oscillibacter sp.]|nr:BREX-1 system adenine-specific DNA-methyltransferase PglX [Oscillibacter sp.]
MDKNAIKKYAVWARCELIERVSQKALQYGITADGKADPNVDSVNGRLLSNAEKKQRRELIRKVNAQGYEQVMEEVAYTWFNRFAALRFMEANGYLPSHVRVFTNDTGDFKPQILSEAIHLDLDGLDMARVYELKNANKDEELFKYLLVTQCNALSPILPKMFQRIADDTELLLPDYLLREGSVIHRMITMIPEEDWRDQVQIIGWLYQYYNTEPKDKVFADLKKNIKITKENIPAATQLFTPDWIVRYMVENSLGRLWLEGHPNDALRAEWKYYLDEAEQEASVQAQLAAIRKEYAALKPEDIKCIDPCMGSGHILCYLFDVLMQIYESQGYAPRDAAQSIVRHNLYGLDIDKRAAQLAYFSVMMKARQYDRRFFSHNLQPMVYSTTGDEDGENFGSLVMVDDPGEMPEDPQTVFEAADYKQRMNVWSYQYLLAQKYHVVVTNPPYMGASNMNGQLSDFIKNNYADYKSDFFSAFFVRCCQLALPNGILGFFSPYVWMFIQSYEKWRNLLCQQKTIETLIQFEYSAFEEATVPVCTFVFSNYHVNKRGCYFRLTDFRGGMEVQRQKTLEAIANHNCGYYYEQSADNFSKIPGAPVAYWWGNFGIFDFSTISDHYESAGRNKTHNNELYVRNWWEIEDTARWQSYANGGTFRRWAGNDFDVVDWSDTAKNFYAAHGGLYNQKYNGKRGICWNLITSYKNGFRLKHEQHHYSSGAPTIISTDENHDFLVLAYLNSIVATALLNIYNPTLNTTVGDVLGLPISFERESEIVAIAQNNVMLSQRDWDSFETSWDFTRHPLVRSYTTVAEAYFRWEEECIDRFTRLKANEEELNRIFIDIYGLQDELTPEVEDKDVTVRLANVQRDIRSLISYAVGCMFGRYSLDVEGLAYAGGEWDASQYTTFQPDKDAILPICDDDYFEDDIVGRFIQWVETVYGKNTLEENLRFIADALGGKGSPREVIRNYFLNDFYADHCKVYQKRPIYWLFDSGKKNGFKALIYMHRYQPDTIARIRTDYVHEQQARYRTAIADLEQRINGVSTSERVKLSKRHAALQAQAAEIREYEEKVHHLADQMIKIDLDDGVKKNYAIFQDILAKIK